MANTKITSRVLADDAVLTANITDANVTTAKIADSNVTVAKMAANSIDSDQYVDGSIDTAHIANDQITTALIADDVALGGNPTTTTQSGSNSTTRIATTAFVQQELTTLIGGAPSTLNDLNELAAAINDDANYNSTLTTALATKLPLAGGTMTGALVGTSATFTSASSYPLTVKSSDADAADIFRVIADDDGAVMTLSKDASDNAEMYLYSGAGAANVQISGNTTSYFNGGNVGIGTTSPNSYSGYTALTINGTSGGLLDFETNGTFVGEVYANGTTGLGIQAIGSRTIVLRTNGGDRMTIDGGGAVTIGGTLGVTGVLTANSGITFGDGHTIGNDGDDNLAIASSANENIIIDSADDIVFDAAGSDFTFKVAGTSFGKVQNSSSNMIIESLVSNKDILFYGNDNGSSVLALTLDMSEAGDAFFGADVRISDSKMLRLGTGQDFRLYHDGSDSYITDTGTGNLLIQFSDLYLSKDGGSTHSMVLRSTGNVGIGTTSPAAKLHVSGDIAVTGANRIYNTNSALYLDSASGESIFLRPAGTTAITIKNGGNVGIGITTPNEAGFGSTSNVLSIAGTAQDAFGVLELISTDVTSSNRIGEIRFGNLDAGSSFASNSGIRATRDGADNSSALSLWTTNAGTFSERLRIDGTGHFTFTGKDANSNQIIMKDSGGATDGTLYAEAGEIGFLDGDGSWAFQVLNNTSLQGKINNSEAFKFIVGTGSHEVMSIGGVTPRNDITLTQQGHGENWATGAHTTNGYLYMLTSSNAGVYMISGQSTWTSNSDERIKENITSLGTVLPEIANIRCVKFNLVGNSETRVGFIAQDWESKSFSEVLNLNEGFVVEADGSVKAAAESDSTDKVKGIAYTETIPVLLKAIQELSAKNDALEARIETLEG